MMEIDPRRGALDTTGFNKLPRVPERPRRAGEQQQRVGSALDQQGYPPAFGARHRPFVPVRIAHARAARLLHASTQGPQKPPIPERIQPNRFPHPGARPTT